MLSRNCDYLTTETLAPSDTGQNPQSGINTSYDIDTLGRLRAGPRAGMDGACQCRRQEISQVTQIQKTAESPVRVNKNLQHRNETSGIPSHLRCMHVLGLRLGFLLLAQP